MLKVGPGRKLMKKIGCPVNLTGTRGNAEAAIRGKWDLAGPIRYNKLDKIWIANPLAGWTDLMVKRYTEQCGLPQHPARKRGAVTIGCLPCGGGMQFTPNTISVLRKTEPEHWRRWMVTEGLGAIILAIKYDEPLDIIRDVIAKAGGLEKLAAERPWIFDYTLKKPLPGHVLTK